MTTPIIGEQIIENLKKYPSKKVEYGTYSIIARKCGVSREYVRRVGTAEGYSIHNIKTLCAYCKSETAWYRKFCSKQCLTKFHFYKYRDLFICDICGMGFVRYRCRFKNNKYNKKHCSKECLYKSDVMRKAKGRPYPKREHGSNEASR